jgi:hypothetical protein
MELHLNISGWLLVALALMHIGLPNYFKWKDELKSLELFTKQMLQVHTFFIALTVFLMGLLCITSAQGLIETELGKKITLGLGVFWLIRLFFQLFIYSSQLWKGKKFETSMHILFTILWTYLSTIFLMVSLTH